MTLNNIQKAFEVRCEGRATPEQHMTVLMYFKVQCDGCDKIFQTSRDLNPDYGQLAKLARECGWDIGPKPFGSVVVEPKNDFCPVCQKHDGY